MSRQRSVCFVVCGIVLAAIYLRAWRLAQPISSQSQRPFGRYTERSAIEQAMPILQAILPDRNDLYVTAYPGYTKPIYGPHRRLWNVNCLDSQGNVLVRTTRDADSGMICQASYDWRLPPVRSHPVSHSSQTALVEAHLWMGTLGFRERWHLVGAPQHRAACGVI